VIDDHKFSPEIQEARDTAVAMTSSFQEAARHAERRDYRKATKVIQASLIPGKAKVILLKALSLEEWNAIDTVFSEYKMRLGNAFCERCWR
jgi:hypothetical protein